MKKHQTGGRVEAQVVNEAVQMALQAVALGGSVSAEHGIGKIKATLLSDMMGEEVMQTYRKIKAFFDPNHILGKGNLI